MAVASVPNEFFQSKEYADIAQTEQNSWDRDIWQSPYFGPVAGKEWGEMLDLAFEAWSDRTGKGKTNAGGLSPMILALAAGAAFLALQS